MSLSSGTIGSMLTAVSLFPSSISACTVGDKEMSSEHAKVYSLKETPLAGKAPRLEIPHLSSIYAPSIRVATVAPKSHTYIFFSHNAAVEYCAVPTFLRALPVSAPCLSSSFKSIYCWRKSIRLSEGKVEHPRARVCVCLSYLSAGGSEKKASHIRRKGAFSLDGQINGCGLQLGKADAHRKHFSWQITSHQSPRRRPLPSDSLPSPPRLSTNPPLYFLSFHN